MAEIPTISIGEGLLLKGDSVHHIPLCLIAMLSLQPLVGPLLCTLAPFHDRTGVLECKQMHGFVMWFTTLPPCQLAEVNVLYLVIVVVNFDSG